MPQDKREAEKWQRKAAEQKPDLAKIVTSYREYVESGRSAAQPILERLESFFETLP